MEIAIVDAYAGRMGKGTMKRDVIEHALREYLRVVGKAGRFVQRTRSGSGRERRKVSQQQARRYEIDERILRNLQGIAETHHWRQADLVRQAILTLGEQAEQPG